MVLPYIGIVMLGRTIYRVGTSKAAQDLARLAIKKYGGRRLDSVPKGKKTSNLTQQVLKDKNPSLLEKFFGARKTSPGRKSKEAGITVGKTRKRASKAAGVTKTVGAAALTGAVAKYATDAKAKREMNKVIREADQKLIDELVKRVVAEGQLEDMKKESGKKMVTVKAPLRKPKEMK